MFNAYLYEQKLEDKKRVDIFKKDFIQGQQKKKSKVAFIIF